MESTLSRTWTTHPEATAFVSEHLRRLVARSSFLADFSERLHDRTGTRIFDWIERLALNGADGVATFGYRPDPAEEGTWRHSGAMLPAVTEANGPERVAVRVESVVDFLIANGLRAEVQGGPADPVRRARVSAEGGVEFWAIEQHGTIAWEAPSAGADVALASAQVSERFRLRERHFPENATGFRHAEELIRAAVEELSVDRTCDLFFAAEREYWQRRNRAARVQFDRQQAFGLGWANHDHHTYRSGRRSFVDLVRVLELLGFECRERFYAGREAGWGAQVLEQPNCRVVIFADVDLAPDEVTQDFAHEPLPERGQLGTVGLWCELHGEAFLEAGMHHLEAQFDFETARRQLGELGVESMAPFTDFPYLKQAFTTGERWAVAPRRLDRALSAGHVTPKQAEKFREAGAIGSHLEILQRDDGYKGFNQDGINEIIRDTDPRKG